MGRETISVYDILIFSQVQMPFQIAKPCSALLSFSKAVIIQNCIIFPIIHKVNWGGGGNQSKWQICLNPTTEVNFPLPSPPPKYTFFSKYIIIDKLKGRNKKVSKVQESEESSKEHKIRTQHTNTHKSVLRSPFCVQNRYMGNHLPPTRILHPFRPSTNKDSPSI